MDHIALSLKDIYFGRKTGQLIVRNQSFLKHLYFQNGILIFAKTSIAEERLGDVLRRMGKLTEDVYKSIPNLIKPDALIGETLVKEGHLTQMDLFGGIVAQMTGIILSLFPPFDAEVSFHPRDRFVEGDIEQKVDIPQLIERGIRQMPFHPKLPEFFKGKMPVARAAVETWLTLSEDRLLLASMKGTQSAADLASSLANDPKTFWKTLYLFYCLDLVELRDATPFEERPAGEDLAPDSEERLQEALEFRRKITGLPDSQILGVSSESGEEDIKKAYFKLARKFHPDSFGRRLASEYKSQIDEIFDIVSKAYRNLSSKDPGDRAASAPPPSANSADKGMGKNAETLFRQGKTLFHQGRFEDAIRLLDEAAKLRDEKADCFLLLAMAQSKVPDLSKKAEKNFVRAIELEPWNAEGYVGLGLLYKREGLASRAKKQFEKAMEIDADHKIARQELESLSEKPERRGLRGILSKNIFGSKKK